jgi:hypothetical protein
MGFQDCQPNRYGTVENQIVVTFAVMNAFRFECGKEAQSPIEFIET